MDHYATLGVLPEADPVVIKAAYRALAQTYHPDKWRGDPAVATRRMAAINEAYRILGDAKLRNEYDSVRARGKANDPYQDEQDEQSGETSSAFSSALSETEQRWRTATSIFPDLDEHRAALARMSTLLAFAFVTLMLETKRFNERRVIAEKLEIEFLSRYFGTNQQILAFAKDLIMAGKKEAAKLLNELVDVMGSDVDPKLLVNQVLEKFPNSSDMHVRELGQELARTGDVNIAKRIAKLRGYTVEQHAVGVFGYKLVVWKSGEGKREFLASDAFTSWVSRVLC
jgi:curved DNA-binding protein CbpA